MGYITIAGFARMHEVTHRSIRYQIEKGNIKTTMRFGIVVINEKCRYRPRAKNFKSKK